MKTAKIIGGFLIVFLAGAGPARAADQMELFYGYYKDSDHLTVNSPSFKISKDLLENTSVTIKYNYETYEKEAPANTMGAVTGATTVSGGTGGGYNNARQEVIAGIAQRFNLTTLGASYFYSTESDYLSNAYSVAVSQDLFDKNFTLTGLFGQSFDDVGSLNPSDKGFPKFKRTNTYTLNATQILTPRLLVSAGYSMNYLTGYLSSPRRQINAAHLPETLPPQSTLYPENEPDLRRRQTFYVRLKQFFLSQTTADLNLTYYKDDWGVRAYSAEPRVEQYLTDNLVARLRFRYYTQTEADFYKPLYCTTSNTLPNSACPDPATSTSLKTADVRLRKFNAYTAGARFGILAFMDWSVYLSYDHYWETNDGIKADIVQLTVLIPY